ncbi:MAG: hypothetical protein K8R44_05655 [Sulfurimonas sp.]|nr:hypothetical protein [Sulfurimonas sp.]
MKKIILLLILTFGLSAKTITPNEVYSQVMLMSDEIHFLLKHYGIKHDHDGIIKRTHLTTRVKVRNSWQISYEILIKINILREVHGLVIIEPSNIPPVLNIKPELMFEQTQRILSELQIFKIREGIKSPKFKKQIYKNKTPTDVSKGLLHISKSFDELNGATFTSSFVFGEQMRIYDDITLILQDFRIKDKTIPKAKKTMAVSEDTFDECMNILEKIKQLQIAAGIDFVDFSEFKKGNETPSDVFTITQMIIAELQTIKAYLGIDSITPAATKYKTKEPSEVLQLASWNFRKLGLINSLSKGK